MKITFLFKNFKLNNGGSLSALEFARSVSDHGQNVQIGLISFNLFIFLKINKIKRENNSHNIKIYFIPGFAKFIYKLSLYEILQKSLNKISHGIVIKSLINQFLELVFSVSKRKRFLEFENVISQSDVIFFTSILPSRSIEMIRSISTAKFVVNHNGSPESFEKHWLSNEHKSSKYNPALSLYVNYCNIFDKLLFQSKDQASESVSRYEPLKEKVLLLLPTCDEDAINIEKTKLNPYNQGKKIIVNVGSIQPRKGQHLSILSFERVVDEIPLSELHFVGDYRGHKQYYLELKRIVAKKNLKSNIFFHGHRKDYLRYMFYADVLLQSSYSEGVSRVLREAMFMKIPIVTFAISGTVGILDNQSALLISGFDISKMSESLCRIFNDPKLNKLIVDNAFSLYLKNHSQKVYKKGVFELLNQLNGSLIKN